MLWSAGRNQRGNLRALARSRHRRALARSRHRRALARSRLWGWAPIHPLVCHQQAQGHMSIGRWTCGGWRTYVSRERPLTSRKRRAYVSRERPLTSRERQAYVSRERPLTSRERRAGQAAGGVEGPPRTADQDQLRAAAVLLHLSFGSVNLSRPCSGKDAGDER